MLDPSETMLYLASGCPPVGRYTSLITHIIRKEQLAGAERWMSAEKADVWIVRDTTTTDDGKWGDVRGALASRIARDYEPTERIGTYQLWRRRDTTPARLVDSAPHWPFLRTRSGNHEHLR